jgi:hypothetical protein
MLRPPCSYGEGYENNVGAVFGVEDPPGFSRYEPRALRRL